MNYIWCLTLISLNFLIFIQSDNENNGNEAANTQIKNEDLGNIALSNSTLQTGENSSSSDQESNKINLNIQTNHTGESQIQSESNPIQLEQTDASYKNNSQAQAINTPNSDIDYSKEYDLSIQSEKTNEQNEYNYQDYNNQTFEDVEEVSNKNNPQEESTEQKDFLEWQDKVADFQVGEMLTVKIKSNRYVQ